MKNRKKQLQLHSKIRILLCLFLFIVVSYIAYTNISFFPDFIIVNSNVDSSYELSGSSESPELDIELKNIQRFERQFLKHRFKLFDASITSGILEQVWVAEDLELSLPEETNLLLEVHSDSNPLAVKLFLNGDKLKFIENHDHRFFYEAPPLDLVNEIKIISSSIFDHDQCIDSKVDLSLFSVSAVPENSGLKIEHNYFVEPDQISENIYRILLRNLEEPEKSAFQNIFQKKYRLNESLNKKSIKTHLNKWDQLDSEAIFARYFDHSESVLKLKDDLTERDMLQLWLFLNTVDYNLKINLLSATDLSRLIFRSPENLNLILFPEIPGTIDQKELDAFLNSRILNTEKQSLLKDSYFLQDGTYHLSPFLDTNNRKKIWLLFFFDSPLDHDSFMQMQENIAEPEFREKLHDYYKKILSLPQIITTDEYSKYEDLNELFDLYIHRNDQYYLNPGLTEENIKQTIFHLEVPQKISYDDFLSFVELFSVDPGAAEIFSSSYSPKKDLPVVLSMEDLNNKIIPGLRFFYSIKKDFTDLTLIDNTAISFEQEQLNFLLSYYNKHDYSYLVLKNNIPDKERIRLKEIFAKVRFFDEYVLREDLTLSHKDKLLDVLQTQGLLDSYTFYALKDGLHEIHYAYLSQLLLLSNHNYPLPSQQYLNNVNFFVSPSLSINELTKTINLLEKYYLPETFTTFYIPKSNLTHQQQKMLSTYLFSTLRTDLVITPLCEYLIIKHLPELELEYIHVLVNDKPLTLERSLENSYFFSLQNLKAEENEVAVSSLSITMKLLSLPDHAEYTYFDIDDDKLELHDFIVSPSHITEEWILPNFGEKLEISADFLSFRIPKNRLRNDMQYHFGFYEPKNIHETYPNNMGIEIKASVGKFALEPEYFYYDSFIFRLPFELVSDDNLIVSIITEVEDIKINSFDLARLRPIISELSVSQQTKHLNHHVLSQVSFLRQTPTYSLTDLISETHNPVEQFYTWAKNIEVSSLSLYRRLFFHKFHLTDLTGEEIVRFFNISNSNFTAKIEDNTLKITSTSDGIYLNSKEELNLFISEKFGHLRVYAVLIIFLIMLLLNFLLVKPLGKSVDFIIKGLAKIKNYFRDLRRINLFLKFLIAAAIVVIIFVGVKKSNILEPFYLTIDYSNLPQNTNISVFYDLGDGFKSENSLTERAPRTTGVQSLDYTLPTSRFGKMKIMINSPEFNLKSIRIRRNPYFSLMKWDKGNIRNEFNLSKHSVNAAIDDEVTFLSSEEVIRLESNFTINSRVNRLYLYLFIFTVVLAFLFYHLIDIIIDILLRIERKIKDSHKEMTGKDIISYLFLYSLILLVLQATEFAWKNLLIIVFLGLTTLVFLFFARYYLVSELKKIKFLSLVTQLMKVTLVFTHKKIILPVYLKLNEIAGALREMDGNKVEKIVQRQSNLILSILFIFLAIFLSLLYSYSKLHIIIIILVTLTIIYFLNKKSISKSIKQLYKVLIVMLRYIMLNISAEKSKDSVSSEELEKLSLNIIGERVLINLITGTTAVILLFFIALKPILVIFFLIICLLILFFNNFKILTGDDEEK